MVDFQRIADKLKEKREDADDIYLSAGESIGIPKSDHIVQMWYDGETRKVDQAANRIFDFQVQAELSSAAKKPSARAYDWVITLANQTSISNEQKLQQLRKFIAAVLPQDEVVTGIVDEYLQESQRPPKQVTSGGTKNTAALPKFSFHFVNNPKLRAMLVRDYEELGHIVEVGAQKSVMLLCGSILEAALVAVLQAESTADIDAKYAEMLTDKNQKAKPAPSLHDKEQARKWSLEGLIIVAYKLGRIGKDESELARIVKDYRDLIHPMAEAREEYKITPHTVQSTLHLFLEALSRLS